MAALLSAPRIAEAAAEIAPNPTPCSPAQPETADNATNSPTGPRHGNRSASRHSISSYYQSLDCCDLGLPLGHQAWPGHRPISADLQSEDPSRRADDTSCLDLRRRSSSLLLKSAFPTNHWPNNTTASFRPSSLPGSFATLTRQSLPQFRDQSADQPITTIDACSPSSTVSFAPPSTQSDFLTIPNTSTVSPNHRLDDFPVRKIGCASAASSTPEYSPQSLPVLQAPPADTAASGQVVLTLPECVDPGVHPELNYTSPELNYTSFATSAVLEGPRTISVSRLAARSAQPSLHLDLNDVKGHLTEKSLLSDKPLPKSPGSSILAPFWGWVSSPSPVHTEFSSLDSALPHQTPNRTDDSLDTTPQDSGTKPYYSSATATSPLQNCIPNSQTSPSPVVVPVAFAAPTTQGTGFCLPSTAAHIAEMEDELRCISSELAASIRRELELEDLVERLQHERDHLYGQAKRTSDYFSDSGVSSAKSSDPDQARDEIEKIQRRGEQERADIRLDLTTKLQDERLMRKELQAQLQELSHKASQLDLARTGNDPTGRVRELEKTCDDLRRKLSDERSSRDNFEDLLGVLTGDLHDTVNERDNLRDEVVPGLKVRVEGLEAEASRYANLMYESTKMQQEMQSLRAENSRLRTTRPPLRAMPIHEAPPTPPFRSASDLFVPTEGQASIHLCSDELLPSSRDVPTVESDLALADRLKDVEAQRDALHNALKSLLERQEFQTRENDKRIRMLEQERDRLLTVSPKNAAIEREIAGLRTEIKQLRNRANDALAQKWQVEKGLGDLRLELERAREQILALCDLVGDTVMPLPALIGQQQQQATIHDPSGIPMSVTSVSLQDAYAELQRSYGRVLNRMQKLESDGTFPTRDEKVRLAVQRLEQRVSSKIGRRETARPEIKTAADELDSSSGDSRALVEAELQESMRRVEKLAGKVQHQLEVNAGLRERLVQTAAREEMDCKLSEGRIGWLQDRLGPLGAQLAAAQAASEELLGHDKPEQMAPRVSPTSQLRQIAFRGEPTPSGVGPFGPQRSALLTPAPSPLFQRSPRLAAGRKSPGPRPGSGSGMTSSTSGADESDSTTATTKVLRIRVVELESALADTECAMRDVVERMSAAQIEVMSLRQQKEDADRDTRRLERIIRDETAKSIAVLAPMSKQGTDKRAP